MILLFVQVCKKNYLKNIKCIFSSGQLSKHDDNCLEPKSTFRLFGKFEHVGDIKSLNSEYFF